MIEKVLLKRSDVLVNGEPKLPTSQDMLYGELAINYKKDYETISTLNDNDEIATFSSDVQVKGWITSATSGIDQTIQQSLSGYVYSVSYNSTDKKIYFYDKENHQIQTYVDTTDFIKDGMVNDVEIMSPSAGTNSGVSCLVITFNTDAGKEDIEIPISTIFNPSSYYTKDDIDSRGYLTSAFTETQLSTASTGNGNVITGLTVNNHQITTERGQVDSLPSVTASDNGKILIVSGGTWTLTTPVIIYAGTGTPNGNLGNNGDIYLQTS